MSPKDTDTVEVLPRQAMGADFVRLLGHDVRVCSVYRSVDFRVGVNLASHERQAYAGTGERSSIAKKTNHRSSVIMPLFSGFLSDDQKRQSLGKNMRARFKTEFGVTYVSFPLGNGEWSDWYEFRKFA